MDLSEPAMRPGPEGLNIVMTKHLWVPIQGVADPLPGGRLARMAGIRAVRPWPTATLLFGQESSGYFEVYWAEAALRSVEDME